MLTTTEEAVVELAEAGLRIARLVEVIPEPETGIGKLGSAIADALERRGDKSKKKDGGD